MRIRLLILMFLASPAIAAEPTPREQVLRLVPPDASICFVVQNLRDQSKTVSESPFAEWATGKIAGALANNAEANKLKSIEAFITAALGVSFAELRDDVLGDCFAFAFEPGPPGQPDQERGTALLYARDPKKLQKLLDALNNLQKQTKDLESLSVHMHNGRKYTKRHRTGGGAEFYFLHDHLFALSFHEDGLKAIIDRGQNPADTKVLKDLNDLKLNDAFLACWLAPRKLDTDLAPDPTANAADRASRAQMAKLWSAVDQCAMYLKVNEGLELGASVHYRAKDIPAEWRAVFDGSPKGSHLWGSIPADAIFALAVDLDANQLLEAVASFLPEAERPKLRKLIENELGNIIGKNNVSKLLSDLGPEIGVWIEKTPKDGPLLPNCTAAVHLSNNSGPLLLKAVRFYAQLIIVDYNRRNNDAISLDTVKIGPLEIDTLSNDKLFPKGTKPAFALSHDFLVIGSNPASVAAFKSPVVSLFSGDVPLIKLNVTALRTHLIDHKEDLADFLESFQDRGESEILKDMETLIKILEAVDRLELTVRGEPGKRTFALKAKLIKPLKSDRK